MILAIDTATRWLGLALIDPGKGQVRHTAGWESARTQTIECSAAIEAALVQQGVTPADLEGIAVAIGPGSYTGLRIGLGVAKGLALVHQTAILPVPTLDILAAPLPASDRPLVLTVEAGRKRIIAAEYRWTTNRQGWRLSQPADILTWDDLIKSLTQNSLVAGEISPAAREQLENHPLTDPLPPPFCIRRPEMLAHLGWQMLLRGETADPATIAPNYLRKPEGS